MAYTIIAMKSIFTDTLLSSISGIIIEWLGVLMILTGQTTVCEALSVND